MEEKTIIRYLLKSDTYFKRIILNLEVKFFKEPLYKNLFKLIKGYANKKNKFLSLDTLNILIEKTNFKKETKEKLFNFIEELEDFKPDIDVDELELATREWIKKVAVVDAIMEAADLIEKDVNLDSIPAMVQKALSEGVTKKLGTRHSDLSRLNKEELELVKIPFELETLNNVTNGGVGRKTLNCIVGAQGAGKTRFLADLAVQYKRQGNNVLIISLEISEQLYHQRIDCNLADVRMVDYLEELDIIAEAIKNESPDEGEIVIQEFPQRSINKNHILATMDHLKTTEGFIPDILIIDYLNLLNSVTLANSPADTYNMVKYCSEEIRAIAQEHDIAIWTATQYNREGMKSAMDPEMDLLSDSYALNNTLDFLLGLYINEELSEDKQMFCKIMKTRYGDKFENNKFKLGIEPDKMRHFDLTPEEALLEKYENNIKNKYSKNGDKNNKPTAGDNSKNKKGVTFELV